MKMIFGENTKQYLLGGCIVLCALIILILVVKYVPLDPTKIEVEKVEEKIHFEVQPDLETKNSKPIDIVKESKIASEVLAPTFDVINLGEDNTLVIGGRAGINQKVEIFNGEQLIGDVTTNQFGEFVFIEELPPGNYDLNLLSNGTTSQKTVSIIASDNTKITAITPDNTNVTAITPDNTNVTAITPDNTNVTAITPDNTKVIANGDVKLVPSNSEAIVTINNADGTVEKVLQGASNNNEANNLSFDSLTYSSEGALNLSGKALPGTRVEVYIGKKLIGTAFADNTGFWNLALDNPVKPGDYILRFNEIQDEKVIASLETPIRQADLSEISILENSIVVQPGNSLWRISRRFYGKGVLHTLIFKANNNQITNPDLIYPGQIFDIPEAN